jgi:DNA gyrase subunit A
MKAKVKTKVAKYTGRELSDYVKRNMTDYSKEVAEDRALPDIKDGCKPVQRRILWAMTDLKAFANSKTIKCGRIVGDTMGKFHPHGDSSIYEALVTMVNNCNPLVQGQGNFGSLTDPAASSRYTEARLSKLGMKTIECNEVADYVPNYTGDMQEPVVIPTRIPYFLLNGSSSIAVGLACNMPAHNLGELIEAYKYVIRKGESATVKGVMKYLKGPEYEYGGRILSDEKEIRSLYKTGKGPIRYSCDYKFEKAKDGSLTLVVTEPCPTFNPAKFLLAMSELMEDKIVTRAHDATTKKDGFRLEVDLKSPAVFEKYIRKHLEKQVTYQYYAIDRQPAEDTTERDVDVQVLSPNLLEAMNAWVDWRRVVETKMLKLELKRARDKLYKEKLRLDASQHIDIIMAAVKQDKIEPREYLVKKLPILVDLVKKGKKEKAFIGADYIGAQPIFSLKKADQSKLKDLIKESLKNIKRIKYDLEHIDKVLVHYLDELKPFATPRKLKLAGSFEETKLRANKNAELQICGASADCKKEVVNLNSKGLSSKYFASTYDAVYYCNSDGQMSYCDAFEFNGKDKGTACVGLTSADVPRFIVRTSKGIHISDNDGKDFFNTAKLKDDEQVVQMEGLYKKSKILFISGNGLVKVVDSEKYESNRRNTGSRTTGTGFKNIKSMVIIPKGCLILTNNGKKIEPEKLKSYKDFVGVVGDTNFVCLKNGKKSIVKISDISSIKTKDIFKIIPIKFEGRK